MVNSIPSGKQPTCPHSSQPCRRAFSISLNSRNTRSGSLGSTNIAAIMTGLPLLAEIFSRNSIVVVIPLVSMKTPRPVSLRAPVSSNISCSSARRDGIGIPFSPLCCSKVDVAKPTAPTDNASTRIDFICATSSVVAARVEASSPNTHVRSEECPQ